MIEEKPKLQLTYDVSLNQTPSYKLYAEKKPHSFLHPIINNPYHWAFSMNLPFSLRWLAKPNGADVEGVKLTCQLLLETTLCLHMMLRLKECFSSYFRTEFYLV